jgi:hypothetical protein
MPINKPGTERLPELAKLKHLSKIKYKKTMLVF